MFLLFAYLNSCSPVGSYEKKQPWLLPQIIYRFSEKKSLWSYYYEWLPSICACCANSYGIWGILEFLSHRQNLPCIIKLEEKQGQKPAHRVCVKITQTTAKFSWEIESWCLMCLKFKVDFWFVKFKDNVWMLIAGAKNPWASYTRAHLITW